MIRTIWGDNDRFKKGYFESIKGHDFYFSGDGARVDEDGYIWITGRVDDVINVSGHRLGTAEIESAIAKCDKVAEVAVVGKPDELKGEGIFAFIIPKEVPENAGVEAELFKEINDTIVREIGPIAKCDEIKIAPGLPKTRSGKIMRRILRSIAAGQPVTQDTSTLEDPSIVEKLQQASV
jgi:acetyl-CoA synthetase